MYFPGTMLLAAGTIMGWMAWNGCTGGAGLGTINGRFPVAMTGGAKYTGVLPGEKIWQVLPCSVQSKISMFHSRGNKTDAKHCNIISTVAKTMTWVCYLGTSACYLDMNSTAQGEAILENQRVFHALHPSIGTKNIWAKRGICVNLYLEYISMENGRLLARDNKKIKQVKRSNITEKTIPKENSSFQLN